MEHKNNRALFIVIILLLVVIAGSMAALFFIREHMQSDGNTGENTVSSSSSSSETVSSSDRSDKDLTAVSVTPAPTASPTPTPAAQTPADKAAAELAGMTLEQKIAQLFYITPEELSGEDVITVWDDQMAQSLQQYPVGGIVLFAQNITDPAQLQALTNSLQTSSSQASGFPLFIGTDEEGGRVARIGSNPSFQVTQIGPMADIGASGDASQAYQAGDTIGGYLIQNGINFDFAPDADVLSNPDNTVIGDRSFGSDPALVASMAQQCSKGLAAHQVFSCYKHFPGHGATAQDSHEEAASTDKTLDAMLADELVPFADAAKDQEDCIMVGHISAPAVTGDNTPASLSQKMITGVLRTQLGYQGVVITDSLSMGAVTNYYDSGTACVTAIQAGADMLLMPEDFQGAYSALIAAVQNGTLTEDRINESVLRILTLKYKWS